MCMYLYEITCIGTCADSKLLNIFCADFGAWDLDAVILLVLKLLLCFVVYGWR